MVHRLVDVREESDRGSMIGGFRLRGGVLSMVDAQRVVDPELFPYLPEVGTVPICNTTFLFASQL